MNSVIYFSKNIAPSKVICIGRNYVAHIEELNNEIPSEPVIFIKPNSSVTSELFTHNKDSIHYETEICFMVNQGKLYAIGLGLDLTKRDIQTQLKQKGLPWERSKAFDHSAVLSEFIELPESIEDISFTLHINGDQVQEGSYALMLHKPQSLLKEIQSFMSTNDGDIIMTGTPKGVGTVKKGDQFEMRLYQKSQCLLTWTLIAK